MSTPEVSPSIANAQPATVTDSRKPYRRRLVPGVLLGVLALLCWELYARSAYSKTLAILEEKLEAQQVSIVKEKANIEREMQQKGEGRNSRKVAEIVMARMVSAPKASEVNQLISAFAIRRVTENTSAVGPMRHEMYVWPSLFNRYELHLNYGVGPDPALITVDSKS